jgi:serine-type D-Ala-D-Ala carboxypeptidase (penicillin-binding protein 5/6)
MRRLLAAVVLLAALAPPAAAQPAPAAGPNVTAKGAVLYDAADDRVLWGSGENDPLPPASTTKVMTVLLALEAGAIDDTVTVSAVAAEIGRRAGAATLNLREGQQIPMRSLLEGLVLRSGNDAAVAVAEHIAGSEDAFVDKMNARAAELGMDDTNFLNSTGLTDDLGHHSSALDLALLADVALANPHFARWAATATSDVPGLGRMTNRNELLGRYPGANGVKTGYTNLAGLCLVASAARDGHALIAVVLGSEESFADTRRIFDHGYTAYRRAAPVATGERVVRYRWAGARVALRAAEPVGRTVASGQEATWRVVLDPWAQLPVERGDQLGRAELIVDGDVVDHTPLTAGRAVEPAAPENGAVAAGAAVQDAIRAFVRLHSVDRAA